MILLENSKATFNYEVVDTLDAGIELLGLEVKALRAKQGSLLGSFVIIRGNEAFLVGASIPPYQPKNTPTDYEPERNRKLLLTRKEIEKIEHSPSGKNLTIVPLSVYNVGRKIKVKIALVRGKKKFDKRETIKRRETDRDIRREFKDR